MNGNQKRKILLVIQKWQLDINEYLIFSCEPLKNIVQTVKKHRDACINERIKPNILNIQ